MAATPEAQALLERWRTETDFTARDELLEQLVENKIFPGKDEEDYELDAGLYPGLDDPEFLPKLMRKREFQESKQDSVRTSMDEGIDKCRSSEDFEITPVQKFISRLLSPRTPYRSALLFHGVGVGKTCAAITVSESYLQEFPGRKVYIVAPPNIQEGFKRTIFDKEGLKIVKGGVNHHRGCTGDLYLDLTGSFNEPNRAVIENRVAKAIKGRYEFFGYTSFYNYILQIFNSLPKGIAADRLEQMKMTALRNEFSNRLIIVDEAHNLRDNPMEPEDDMVDDAAPTDSADAKAGKKLTPFLKEVLSVGEGITFILMTATPMYNSFTEIVFLMNLLLTNEKFERLRVEDVFDVKRQTFAPGGREVLGKVASKFISFMRGENPLTFPLRLEPMGPERVVNWPNQTPKGEPIDDQERLNCARLQCMAGSFDAATENLYKSESRAIIESGEGLGITNMDILIQAGNWIFPADDDDQFLSRIRQQGFENTFSKEKRGSTVQFRSINEERGASWLAEPNLPEASGKCAVLLKRLNGCRGVAFVYSRFVASGALTIALALEANGYTCWNREMGFLAEGNQGRDGRKCALCPRYERGHGTVPKEDGTAEHSFKPARYVLLTGSEELSPNNAKSIDAARAASNVYGEDVKVIIGSQIAGEGLDLRYVREVFVYDSWYHLNKLEQIIGRGIRNCSHAALGLEKRNCTISLLVNTYVSEPGTETIDMYSYRQALRKAIVMGNVTRVLKEYAIDCSLNKEAILVRNLDPVARLYDSQGAERTNVSINDVPLTPMCDWLQTCEYDCKYGDNDIMNTEISLEMQNTSTYNEYTAMSQMNKLRVYLQDRISRGTPFVTFERIENDFPTIPRPLLANLLNQIVEKRDFKITTEYGTGYIIFKNGYYIFQPEKLQDTQIPIALRVANIPVPRDRFTPKVEEVAKNTVNMAATVGVEASKKISSAEEDSEALWNEVLEWCREMYEGTADTELPPQIMEEVRKLPESGGLEKVQKERLDIVPLMYNIIREDEATRRAFADVVLEYIWDEYITTGTKRELLNLRWDKTDMKSVARDSYWEFDGGIYIRLLNGGTNVIEYICVDPSGRTSPCPRSIVEVLERESGQDPLLKYPIDVRYTGFEYGFLSFNPRKNRVVFKKNVPPMPRGKVTRGSECAINSGTAFQIQQLERCGRALKEKGHNNFGLDAYGVHYRNIKNSIRICTISDLVLRYMDRLKLHGKRWFYRALESKLHNHPLR